MYVVNINAVAHRRTFRCDRGPNRGYPILVTGRRPRLKFLNLYGLGNWETAAFGYHARALGLNSGSDKGTLAIRDMRRRLFNGERRSRESKSRGRLSFRGRLSVRRFSATQCFNRPA